MAADILMGAAKTTMSIVAERAAATCSSGLQDESFGEAPTETYVHFDCLSFERERLEALPDDGEETFHWCWLSEREALRALALAGVEAVAQEPERVQEEAAFVEQANTGISISGRFPTG